MAQDAGEQGTGHFMVKWIATENVRVGLQHVLVCPNVTEKTKDRIAESKRVRVASLAIVD